MEEAAILEAEEDEGLVEDVEDVEDVVEGEDSVAMGL